MNPWFRFYEAVLDDPKVQLLSGDLFKFWVNTLCLASRNNGVLPSIEAVSFAFRMSLEMTKESMGILMDAGLIDEKRGILSPHNWNKRQYKSDVSTSRVKRFRKRSSAVSETPPETPPDTDTEQTQNRADSEQKKSLPRDAAMDEFTTAHGKLLGSEYPITSGDATQLAALRKANHVPSRASPDGWPDAVQNYFASPMPAYTLADLSRRFGIFKNSRLDRYGKPVNHQNANGGRDGKTKTERNREAGEELLRTLADS